MIRHHVLTTRDADSWRAVLPASASVFRSLEYARILERHAGAPAQVFVAELDGAVAAYPFFVRSARGLPFAEGLGHLCDTCTPEYTGPTWVGPAAPDEARGRRFAELFAAHCREHRVIAEFAHLSPWAPPELLDPSCVRVNRDVVYVDLTWGEQAIWTRSFTTDARRNCKQADRAGVRVRRASSLDDVREFHRLYELTMARRNALDRYYFPVEQFLEIFEEMPDHALFALAEHEGRIAAGGLFFHDATEVVWHLSAMDKAHSGVRPVNAYLWDTIRWGVARGKRRMLCGSGYQPGDGVASFKAALSPLRAQFRTYQRVHDREAYDALTRSWSAHHGGVAGGEEFFPAYRGAHPAPATTAQPPRDRIEPDAALA